ncbi:MAG: hypothetical protein E4H40_01955 [Candidatus Brocadiia bacterium]|nr:MAG: hypothetical protein E4H40_01955 [Candidatus Brocadiia bacterium]
MSYRLKTVGVFFSNEEANLAKIALAENDIDAIIVGDNLLAAAPEFGLPKVELKVFEDQFDLAKSILESTEEQEE